MLQLTDRELDFVYEAMGEDERAEFDALIAAQAGPSLRDYIAAVSPHLPPPRHLSPVIDALELARRAPIRVCVDMPPRHAKTTLLSHALGWWEHNWPSDTSAYYSYSDRQGRSKSRIVRDMAERTGLQLDPASKDLGEWRTLLNGGLIAGGAGGKLTGMGVSGLFVVDDPYRNRQDADSAIIRNRIWEWFNEVVFTRQEGASFFVMHTRWHPDDLIGRLIKMGWISISLPAIARENDPIGRKPGEALWPERFDLQFLENVRKQIGEWSFSALYQGQPRRRGDKVFHDPHFYEPSEFSIEGKRIVIGVDPAASEKTRADYSAAVVLAIEGRGASQRAWILDVLRLQVLIPAFCDRLVMLQGKFGGRLAIEAVGGFKAVPQMLRRIDPRLKITEVEVRGDKFTRAQPVAAAWNDGRVMVPRGTQSWLTDFLTELDDFTGVADDHDDMVDALAHAWNCLAYAPNPVRRGTYAAPARWR